MTVNRQATPGHHVGSQSSCLWLARRRLVAACVPMPMMMWKEEGVGVIYMAKWLCSFKLLP
jgi:hypothetical protein